MAEEFKEDFGKLAMKKLPRSLYGKGSISKTFVDAVGVWITLFEAENLPQTYYFGFS